MPCEQALNSFILLFNEVGGKLEKSPVFIYEKNAYRTLSYNFIEQNKCMKRAEQAIFPIYEIF